MGVAMQQALFNAGQAFGRAFNDVIGLLSFGPAPASRRTSKLHTKTTTKTV